MASSSLRPSSPAPSVTPLETITFPDGEQHHVIVRDAHRLVIEFRVDPMEEPNARHVHDCSDEVFEVLGGTLWFELEGVEHTLRAGDRIDIPRSAEHRWRVVGTDALHARVTFEPGCDFDTFLRDQAALARAGRLRPDGTPGLRDFALMQRRHRRHLRVTIVPRPVLAGIVLAGTALAAVTGRQLPTPAAR
ncbi:MAG TPA: cupin domain-containing protein [Baekduia sp.]|nr:cupin domain-containing protein [Baekduia sp.]